ncbi:hypothetical protein Dalu01_03300 [Deinococcus aluminii]|uniref:Transposase n=1 Tax=Deinococcus aluminii TaxID=1656885 RepID=A0ABP9XHP9_9DEIO
MTDNIIVSLTATERGILAAAQRSKRAAPEPADHRPTRA